MGQSLASLISVALEHGRFQTLRLEDGLSVRGSIDSWKPHLIVMDLDNNNRLLDGLGRGIARGETPLLGLTRKRDTGFKLKAFESGLDDIIEVPFTLDEIVVRAYALIRRAHGIVVPLVSRIKLDSMEVDLLAQRVNVDGKSLALTALQQTLLYLLAANANEVLTREEILGTIWGSEFEIESNVVDRHIRDLRDRLDDDWRRPRFIETVPGRGYRFLAAGPDGGRPN
jgi:DNA-binding response OmpR family regulator